MNDGWDNGMLGYGLAYDLGTDVTTIGLSYDLGGINLGYTMTTVLLLMEIMMMTFLTVISLGYSMSDKISIRFR